LADCERKIACCGELQPERDTISAPLLQVDEHATVVWQKETAATLSCKKRNAACFRGVSTDPTAKKMKVLKSLKSLVGATGIEPVTPAV
jgi:hypothetical protein